ncbi:hypothetical protein NOCARDAX2BIS_30049 [Nocardioides sp. AX2bis]|nr:hypothetical protein NOCARDAX2BIS_30049 [Nocardioides sp. AX2bis]
MLAWPATYAGDEVPACGPQVHRRYAVRMRRMSEPTAGLAPAPQHCPTPPSPLDPWTEPL